MIEIKSQFTGEVLLTVDADTLIGADLRGANLRDADLIGADLFRADLRDADLIGADLSGANLFRADLSGAILSRAILSRAFLSDADLSDADLKDAHLTDTHLTGADLTGADLTGAYLLYTTFAFCDMLHKVIGLDRVHHLGPCALDQSTLQHCVAKLPGVFLEGVGYTRKEIIKLRDMYPEGGIQYYSCFLSHAQSDDPFVDKLYEDLGVNNVGRWHYKHDMPGGETFDYKISQAIRENDKFVLICSKNSLLRENVVKEIVAVTESEQRFGQKKLLPVLLDNYLFDPELDAHAERMVRNSVWSMNWVKWVRDVWACDFRNWQDPDAYKKEFDKLLDALRIPPARG